MSKISNVISKTGKSMRNMPKGKKIYAGLWAVTGVFLISLIGVLTGFAPTLGAKDTTKAEWIIKQELVAPKEVVLVDKDATNDGIYNPADKDEITLDGVKVTSLLINGVKVDLANLTDAQFKSEVNEYKDYKPNTFVKPDYKKINVAEIANFNDNINNGKPQNVKAWEDVRKLGTTFDTYQFVNPEDVTPIVNGTLNPNYDKSLTGVYTGSGADEKFTIISPHYTNNYLKVQNPNNPKQWNTVYGNPAEKGYALSLTSEAKSQQNAIASVGALFGVGIAASIFTTAAVEYGVKKRGGKK